MDNPGGAAKPALIGRQHEMVAVWRGVEAAVAGRLGVVLLAGEPGIGKTRLLNAVAERAEAAGVSVRHGGASDAEGMPPYLPFLEALGQHIRTAAVELLRQQVGDLAGILATIFPELATRLGDRPTSYPLPPEQARLRLFEAVADLLQAIAAPGGLLLILDDVQWADPTSLDLLAYVARHRPAARLLVLGAYRAGELASNPALVRAIAELNRLRVLTDLMVGPLGATEVDALATALLGSSLDPVGSEHLFRQSEGNPFFAEEILRGWLESGSLVPSGGASAGRGYVRQRSPERSAPPSIVGAVRQRLGRLPSEVVDVLRVAAVIGRSFDVALLAEIVGEEPESVEDRLRVAEQARLIRDETGESFRFSHDKIRECLYADVSAFRRRRLHGLIGHALESRSRSLGPQHTSEIAFHFARSGDRARGAAYARHAAEHASRAYAYDEALTHYRTALELADPNDPKRGELLLAFGDAAILAGAEPEATPAFEQAHDWFIEAGEPLTAGRAAYRLGQARWRQEAVPEARAAFELALGHLADHPGPDLVRILADLATLLAVSLHEKAAAADYGQRALEVARTLGDERTLAAASRTIGNLLVRTNDLAGGIALLEQAEALAAASDDPAEAAECCANLAMAYFWQGAIQRSRQATGKRLAFAGRTRDPYELRHVYTWLGVLDAMQGRLVEARGWLERAQTIVERLASPEPRAFLFFCLGALDFSEGEYVRAETRLREAIALFREIGPGALIWYLGMEGRVKLALGKVAEATANATELESLLTSLPEGTDPPPEAIAYLTAALLALGDRAGLDRWQPTLLRFKGQYADLLVDRLLGEIETLRGNWATASTYLDVAEETARREELPYELELIREAKSRLTLTRGRRRPLRERRPGDLSAREVEVLGLVVAGESNREIAVKLVLSEKTIENHLSSIYGKIGVENRAAATAFAIRHGLA